MSFGKIVEDDLNILSLQSNLLVFFALIEQVLPCNVLLRLSKKQTTFLVSEHSVVQYETLR